MCTGRLDLSFVLRAFSKGMDGVFVAGCHLNECNYITHGNFYALSMVHLCKRLLETAGLNPDRLRMELISGGEGTRFAQVVNDFSKTIRQLGPLGEGEGIEAGELKPKLDVLNSLVPYIKLAKREKLGTRLQREEEYTELYSREEVDALLREVPAYYIDPAKCQACMTCAKRCPVDAIAGGKNLVHVVDQDKCIKCGTCLEVCPPRFGAVTKLVGEPVPPPLPEEKRAIVRKGKEKEAA
jgi:coenzyme F420-reducing hydrogenase delta subunit/Fe-S-cluster-containing hydrogenase component 2